MGIYVGVWKKVRCIKYLENSKSLIGILGCYSLLFLISIKKKSFIVGLIIYEI